MKIKIQNNGGIPTSIYLDENEIKQVHKFTLSQDANAIDSKLPKLELGIYAFNTFFEGEGEVEMFTVINGKKYRLIEENTAPLADETVDSVATINSCYKTIVNK